MVIETEVFSLVRFELSFLKFSYKLFITAQQDTKSK